MKGILIHLTFLLGISDSYKIAIFGGTGKVGRIVSSSLANNGHDITILCRNAFLAATPNRVSEDFGWLGQSFMENNKNIRLRDWDGGDLLDIVGCDFLGWQDDALKPADIVINLTGGYTDQRVMATERIVRESLSVNPNALQITVSPTDEQLAIFSKGLLKKKIERVKICEDMVKQNCLSSVCLREEFNDINTICEDIISAVNAYEG